jgi:hypothetical protein
MCGRAGAEGPRQDRPMRSIRSGACASGIAWPRPQRGPEGATIDALVKATGWLPHTTRAALTGLRKRGYAIGLSRTQEDGSSVYRLTPPSQMGGLNPTPRTTGSSPPEGKLAPARGERWPAPARVRAEAGQ